MKRFKPKRRRKLLLKNRRSSVGMKINTKPPKNIRKKFITPQISIANLKTTQQQNSNKLFLSKSQKITHERNSQMNSWEQGLDIDEDNIEESIIS